MNIAEREYNTDGTSQIWSSMSTPINTRGLTPSNNLSKQMINDIHQFYRWWRARSQLVFSLPDYKNLRVNMWFWTIMLSIVLAQHSYLQKFPLELISGDSYRGDGSQRLQDWNSALWDVLLTCPNVIPCMTSQYIVDRCSHIGSADLQGL